MPAEYEVLEPGGHQAFADAAKSYADAAANAAAAGITDANLPSLLAGAARSLTGDEPTEATFLERACPGTTGQATIQSVKGNTLRWNQIVPDAGIHKSGTETSGAWLSTPIFAMTSGHKYLLIRSGKYPSYGLTCRVVSTTGSTVIYSATPDVPNKQGIIFGCTDTRDTYYVQAWVEGGEAYDFYLNLFDLTAMFGAGNEPATVAEFTALYPEPYYPYDAGSLLPVRMEGIETVGFNQWDEQWEVGEIADATGQNSSASGRIRAKNFIPCFANTSYYLQSGLSTNDLRLYYYDAYKGYIGHTGWLTNGAITTPSGCRYMRFATGGAYGATYKGDICINISDPARNGTYEPYWRSERTIPASTYFPDGMRSAGTVRDELTETQAITRVGSVDLGTLTWIYNASAGVFYANLAGSVRDGNLTCSKYETSNATNVESIADKSVWNKGYAFTVTNVVAKDTAYTDPATFKAAMSGVMLHYALATPTITPIDPPLNLTYRAEQGGTERITHAQQSAPPVLSIAYGHTAEGIVQEATSAIAAQDGPTATANHSVGSYLTMGGTLYRVTTAIATGEAITPGTNVTATTVMAEVLSLIQ